MAFYSKNSPIRSPILKPEQSMSIMQEIQEYSTYKTSLSVIKKELLKVSISINRGREYSKPIELTTWKNRLFLGFIVILSISVGIIQVLQSGINIALGVWLKNPLRSAFVSFIIGDLCLLPFYFGCNNVETTEIISVNKSSSPNNFIMHPITSNGDYSYQKSINKLSHSFSQSISIFNPNTKQQEEVTIITPRIACQNIFSACSMDKQNYIISLNGALGAFFVCSVIYIPPLVGFSIFYIAVVIGQIVTAQLIDHFGLFWAFKKRLTLISLFGSLLAICGAFLFQMPGFVSATHSYYKYNATTIGYVVIAFLSGVAITSKSTLDRRLKKIMNGTAYQSTFLSFVNSTIILLVVNIIVYVIEGDWFQVNNNEFEWWIFFGGVLGPAIVTIYIIAPSYIGFVATFICAIFGSLMTSFLFDITGAFGVHAHSDFGVYEIIGLIVVLIGSVLVNVRKGKQVKNKVKKRKINDFSVQNNSKLDAAGHNAFMVDDGTRYLVLADHVEEEHRQHDSTLSE
eukprot:310288_1